MVASVHLAAPGPLGTLRCLRRAPRPEEVPGLRGAHAVIPAPLSAKLRPRPALEQAGLVAAWEGDAALDRFLAGHPLARLLEGGYLVRMSPLRSVGEWPEFGELEPEDDETAGGGRVAVLTLGRLRPRRALAFLRASARAEGEALADPALELSTGLARPGLVITFSVWRDAPSMREFAVGAGGGHRAAVQADGSKPFHRASAFIRWRPYGEIGRWPGTASSA